MITCQKCKERLYPDDPSIHTGRYHLSTCEHYCNKPEYYRALEQEQQSKEQVIVHRHSNMSKQENDLLQELSQRLKGCEQAIGIINQRKADKRETKHIYE